MEIIASIPSVFLRIQIQGSIQFAQGRGILIISRFGNALVDAFIQIILDMLRFHFGNVAEAGPFPRIYKASNPTFPICIRCPIAVDA
jgi:hypothetical protein